MRTGRLIVLACAVVVLSLAGSCAADADAPGNVDSDHDGLSDQLEQELLVHFAPSFHVDPQDCAGRPTFFVPDSMKPVATSEDTTIYGAATPWSPHDAKAPLVELRYFHLWRSDCGRMPQTTQSGALSGSNPASFGLSVISSGSDFRAIEPVEIDGKPFAG